MKTQIYRTYEEFLYRENKATNGVSAEAAKGIDLSQETTNEGCWNCSGCSRCSRCSDCSDCYDCSDCSGCSRCYDCSGCSRCYGCSGCSDCSRCSDCSDCSDCSGCSRCRSIPQKAKYACFVGCYEYVCSPRIHNDGEQWIQLGCMLRKRTEWESDFWNNHSEFPNDGSKKSNARMFAFKLACLWLDEREKQ